MSTAPLVLPRRRNPWKIVRNEGVLYLFVLPAVAFTLLFAYLPMFINIIAFMDWDAKYGWLGLASPWVGLKHFRTFINDSQFLPIIGRTLYYSGVKLLFTFPAPIIFALLLNELRSNAFKRVTQTVSYIPFFVSWVTVAGLVYMFLSTTSSGLVNNIIERLGGERVIFMAQPRNFLPLLVITDVWKAMGFNSIIFIASVASIEQQLYEAAMIDGASRWQRMRFITLPGIMPAVVIVAILTAGSIFSANFDQIWTLLNPVIRTQTFVINVWAYYVGIASRKYSLGTAINLFQSLISFGLVMLANFVSRKVRGSGLF